MSKPLLKLIRTVIHTQIYPFLSPNEGGEGRMGKRACTLRWGPTRSGRRSRALVFLSLSLLVGAGGRGKGIAAPPPRPISPKREQGSQVQRRRSNKDGVDTVRVVVRLAGRKTIWHGSRRPRHCRLTQNPSNPSNHSKQAQKKTDERDKWAVGCGQYIRAARWREIGWKWAIQISWVWAELP
jgi:hypothetical protein